MPQTMSDGAGCWLFHIWRFAWARTRYQAIGGWRRLFWRLWWRLPVQILPPAPSVLLVPPVPKPPKILHLVLHPDEVPICGASVREPWTLEPEFATCSECREAADRRMTQWRANTR